MALTIFRVLGTATTISSAGKKLGLVMEC